MNAVPAPFRKPAVDSVVQPDIIRRAIRFAPPAPDAPLRNCKFFVSDHEAIKKIVYDTAEKLG